MPIYCYRCCDCGHYEEIKQNFNDKALTECTKCKGKFQRIITSVGIMFKGKGFHVTDYSNKTVLPSSSGNGESKAPALSEKTEGASKSAPQISPETNSVKKDKN